MLPILIYASNAAALGGSSEPETIGGIAIGAEGEESTIYEGFTLSWGDDFTQLDILAPHRPRGRWWPTRTYLAGARGSDTLLGTMYDTDPYFTGHNDSNRGVPVGYDNMSLADSVLSLQARAATSGEQAHMYSTRNEVASMVSGPGAVHWYPGTAGTEDIIVEARIKFSTSNPSGWHPTFWFLSLNPALTYTSNEGDIEGNDTSLWHNRNVWVDGVNTPTTSGSVHTYDGEFHVFAFILNTTNQRVYVDGSLEDTIAENANTRAKPQYPLLTSHVFNGTYHTDAYSSSEWDADGDGATMEVDWIRVWRRTGKSHFAPLASVSDANVDYGASTTVTLPSKTALWGDADVVEYVQAVYNEENEPGVTHSSVYQQFPTGVSYDSGDREVTVNITSGKTGRLNFVVSAWKADGSTGEPLRFAVNVGPNIDTTPIELTAGSSAEVDIYAVCDCGVLTSNGTAKSKTIEVSGLAGSGLSYSDSTGLLTGTPVHGDYELDVTVTNSEGQSANATIPLLVSSSTFELNYVDTAADTADSTAYTFAVDLGDEGRVAAVIHARGTTNTPPTATLHIPDVATDPTGRPLAQAEYDAVSASSNWNVAAVYEGVRCGSSTTGASGEIRVTFGATMFRCAIETYKKPRHSGNPVTDSSSASPPTATLAVPTGGAALAAGTIGVSTTWSHSGGSLSEDVDSVVESFLTYTSGRDNASSGSTAYTLTPASGTGQIAVFVAWAP